MPVHCNACNREAPCVSPHGLTAAGWKLHTDERCVMAWYCPLHAPEVCPHCGGSGGGPGPVLVCHACDGTGRRRKE